MWGRLCLGDSGGHEGFPSSEPQCSFPSLQKTGKALLAINRLTLLSQNQDRRASETQDEEGDGAELLTHKPQFSLLCHPHRLVLPVSFPHLCSGCPVSLNMLGMSPVQGFGPASVPFRAVSCLQPEGPALAVEQACPMLQH